MLIFCTGLKTLSSEHTNMKISKWSSKIKLKLDFALKYVRPGSRPKTPYQGQVKVKINKSASHDTKPNKENGP